MKRALDIFLGIVLGLIFAPIILIIFLLVFLEDGSPVIYWSKRVGKNSNIFNMPKIRTMKLDAPAVATHLLKNPKNYVTNIGYFLRRFSLDELPQIYSILKGDMSIVGPRPALYNQYDLIKLRQDLGVDVILPGLTGWAQISGRDELSIEQKVEFDHQYLMNMALGLDIKIIFLTIIKTLLREDIRH